MKKAVRHIQHQDPEVSLNWWSRRDRAADAGTGKPPAAAIDRCKPLIERSLTQADLNTLPFHWTIAPLSWGSVLWRGRKRIILADISLVFGIDLALLNL